MGYFQNLNERKLFMIPLYLKNFLLMIQIKFASKYCKDIYELQILLVEDQHLKKVDRTTKKTLEDGFFCKR
jgi:hypothetical protein